MTNAKLTNAKEKMRNATTKRDTAVSEKKTAMSNLATKGKCAQECHERVVGHKEGIGQCRDKRG
jgi:hypothetical protein